MMITTRRVRPFVEEEPFYLLLSGLFFFRPAAFWATNMKNNLSAVEQKK
jgi:hypothetical protein